MAFVVYVGRSLQDVANVATGARPVDWAALQEVATEFVLVMLVTIALFLALRAIGQRIYRAMSRRSERKSWLFSLVWVVASSVIDALIIVLAWAGGYVFALMLGDTGSMDVRQSLFLNAFLIVELAKVVLRAIFAPRFDKLRLAPDERRDGCLLVLLEFTPRRTDGLWPVAGRANPERGRVLAVGQSVRALVAVTALLMAVLIVLQNREPVRAALRARHDRNPSDAVGKAQAAIARIWHWLAIAYLIALVHRMDRAARRCAAIHAAGHGPIRSSP